MLPLIRLWIPLALVLAGLIVIGIGGATEEALEVGIPIFSAGLSIWLLNFLYRVGVSGDRDRDVEAEARVYFERHGRWPDDESGGTRTGTGTGTGRGDRP